jgi:sugar lactone lactonase YvrE
VGRPDGLTVDESGDVWVALAWLFITTSRGGLQPGDDPLAGSLFRAAVGVRGRPAREFAG